MDIVLDPELCGSPLCLVRLALAELGVARVLRRAPVGDADDAQLVAPSRVESDRPAHPEHLVVRVRGEHEDAGHPSTAPTGSSRAASTSSSRSAPSPQATTGPSATTVPAAASPAKATGRADHTTTLSSPR